MRRDDIIEAMRSREPELRALGVARLSIFGSAARDEITADSDIDVLVTFRGFMRVNRLLENALGRKVDMGRPETLKPRIRDQVLDEAIDVLEDAHHAA